MSRKDYELIAKILRDTRELSAAKLEIISLTLDVIIAKFAASLVNNPGFDVDKFHKACNYEKFVP